MKAKVDTIGNGSDKIQEYSFQYNAKIVGVPERLQDDSTASISKLWLNIFKETGADVSMSLPIVFLAVTTTVSQSRLFADLSGA